MYGVPAGRPEAAAAIWDWKQAAVASDHESNGAIRLRGTLRAVAGVVVGALVYHYLSTLMGSIVLGITALLFLAAVLSPTGAYAIVERLFTATSSSFGRLISAIVLPAVFFLVFVPFGLVMRRGKRDEMRRFYEDRETYWSKRDEGRSGSAHRERQF